MAVYDFSTSAGSSIAFDASADVLALSGDPTGYRIDASGSTVVVTRQSDGVTLTLTGTAQEQLTTSNLIFSGSSGSAVLGDDAVTTTADNNPNTITNGNVGITASNLDANNLIYGLGGGDTITVGDGANVIFGGMGLIDTADGSDAITIGFGSNWVTGNAGNDTITWGTVVASGQSASVYGGLGNDGITSAAHAGNILAVGGSGQDTINLNAASTGDVTVYGGNGLADSTDDNDTITVGTGNALVTGNAGNDTITNGAVAASKAQSIYGGLGNDTVTSGGLISGSSLLIAGGSGTDTLDFDAALAGSNVTVYGGTGIADSDDGADAINTGAGNAIVYANGGNDTLIVANGGAVAASNQQTIYLGTGDDSVSTFSGIVAGTLSIFGNEGDDSIVDASASASTGNLTLDGGAGDDIITAAGAHGAASTTSISGGEGSDTITIGAYVGAATISGGAGVDTVVTGALANAATALLDVDLGDGNDTITLGAHGAASKTTIDGGEGNDSVNGAASGGAHTITGGAGNDTLTGGTSTDSIDGGDDADTIVGSGGVDTLLGGGGNDTISGGGTTDSIDGGAGNDSIDAGAGADTLTGGTGNDVFQYTSGADGTDKIMDFVSGTDDYDTDFTINTAGNYNVSTSAANTGAALNLASNTTGVFQITGLSITEAAAATYTAGNSGQAALISNGTVTVNAAGDDILVALQTATDTFLYEVAESGANTDITDAADTWTLVAIFDNGVTLATGDII